MRWRSGRRREHEVALERSGFPLEQDGRAGVPVQQETLPQRLPHRPQVGGRLRFDRPLREVTAEPLGRAPELSAGDGVERGIAVPDVGLRIAALRHGYVQAQPLLGRWRLDLAAIGERGDGRIKKGSVAAGEPEAAMGAVEPGRVAGHRNGERHAQNQGTGDGPPACEPDEDAGQENDDQREPLGPDQRRRGQHQPGQRAEPHRWIWPPHHEDNGQHDQECEERVGEQEMLELDLIRRQQHGGHREGGPPAGQANAPQQQVAKDADAQADDVLNGDHRGQAVEGPKQPQHGRVTRGADRIGSHPQRDRYIVRAVGRHQDTGETEYRENPDRDRRQQHGAEQRVAPGPARDPAGRGFDAWLNWRQFSLGAALGALRPLGTLRRQTAAAHEQIHRFTD